MASLPRYPAARVPAPILAGLAGLGFAAGAIAAEATTDLPGIVVTARVESAPSFDLPASLDTIDLRAGSMRPQASLSETLGGVPGVLARDRQNLAQDTQLSIRGFGARSTFGVRGVRLYADGIPATMPDGQGQLSHFALAAGDRVEIMRGPFSALYGNSSGGVVQLWSADGSDPAQVDARLTASRYGGVSASARLLGLAGGTGYNLAAAALDTDGYREHSAARRGWLNAKLHRDLPGGGRLELVGNHLDSPQAQDPLGLTWAQVLEDPRQATPQALLYDTRKSVRQDQLGASLRQPLGEAGTLRVSGYGGARAITQYLAVPVAAQASPLSAGGVVDLDGGYGGLDARVAWQGQAGGRDLEFTAGASLDRQRQQRRGYENFSGDRLGVRGALRRDQRDTVASLDQYAQAWWRFAPRWSLLAGARHSVVRFDSVDHYVTADNPDDSGKTDYSQVTPVAGLVFAANADLRLYLSAGRGFETPTLNELAYRADGSAGLAFDLRPAVSRNRELGMKWRNAAGASLDAALFLADTDDELAVARNSGGRSSYRNVGRARRQGVEVSSRLPLSAAWSLQLAGTWLDAHFRDAFPLCSGACGEPVPMVAAGTSIPGIPARQGFARLQWNGRPVVGAAWEAAIEATALGPVPVDDRGSASAPGYGLLNLEAGRRWTLRQGRLRGFARIDNLFDRRYIGSVIVNEANGRYYEPGPGRNLLLGVEWQARQTRSR